MVVSVSYVEFACGGCKAARFVKLGTIRRAIFEAGDASAREGSYRACLRVEYFDAIVVGIRQV